MYKVKDKLDVTMNQSNQGDHVTDIEINNIKVEEIYCAEHHGLTFSEYS